MLLVGVFKHIRSLLLPWLILYMLAIIGLVVATVVIGIAFVILDFTGVGLVLTIVPVIAAGFLIYW